MSEQVKRWECLITGDEGSCGLCERGEGGWVSYTDYTRLAAERDRLSADLEHLNDMLRRTGYGQGQIDDYVYQCEEVDRLTEENSKLRSQLKGPIEIKLEHRGD